MRHALAAALLVVATDPATAGEQPCPQIAGWAETVAIGGVSAAIEAKLDTGAETSALSASEITVAGEGSARVVRFQVAGSGKGEIVEAPFVRWAGIRRAGTRTDRRPVVRLPLCLGGVTTPAEFTLTDRTGLDYPVLIGRAALSGRIVVDSGRDHVAAAGCGQ